MEILQITWFVLWSLLWIMYFALDGFDLGCGIVMNFIARDENEKRSIINSIGPFWDGNEVWLITAGGATFAAFPAAYADMFSWLYVPLFLVLAGLIFRGVSFELRGKTENKRVWDIFIFAGSLAPAFLLGAVFGNLWASLPVCPAGYSGGLTGLLNVNGFLTALVFVSFFVMHGLIWIALKTEGEMDQRAYGYSVKSWHAAFFFFALFLLLLPFRQNPNFSPAGTAPALMAAFYALAAASFLLIRKKLKAGKLPAAFGSSLAFLIFFFAASFSGSYPNIIPSSLSPEFNVSVFNSSSGLYTLKIMTAVALLFVPLVIGYQVWVYRALNHKINPRKPETLHY